MYVNWIQGIYSCNSTKRIAKTAVIKYDTYDH